MAVQATQLVPSTCELDSSDCLSLYDILHSFNQPISEEQAWAVCYQAAKCFYKQWSEQAQVPKSIYCTSDTAQLLIHREGEIFCPALLKPGKCLFF